MMGQLFRKSIAVSILWHTAVFSIFSLSAADRLVKANYAGVAFWGQILSRYDFANKSNFNPVNIKGLFLNKSNAVLLDKNREVIPVSSCHLKPQIYPVFNPDKNIPVQNAGSDFTVLPKKKSVVMFYPQLPYHFLLYFKDRQTVHIELMFNLISKTNTNAVAIKRKISSGNLEVDLLTMRYLSHYLFIQQIGVPTNSWQTVKIELSPKND